MFDVSWSEFLIVGIVALLVVGPKEMPVLLRTVGKYLGMIRRQAAEFRAQFDEAMREAELDQLRKEVEGLKQNAESVLRDTEASVTREVDDARRALDDAAAANALTEPPRVEPVAPTAPAPTIGMPEPGSEPSRSAVNGHALPAAETPPSGHERPEGAAAPKAPV